jgi:hypothetical protein
LLGLSVAGALILGMGALYTGIGNASGAQSGRSGVSAEICKAIQDQIKASREIDAGEAIECDQIEFEALQDERQKLRAQGQNQELGDVKVDVDVDTGFRSGW